MKRFLSKKSSFLAFVIAASVLLVYYIVRFALPVSYGMSYIGKGYDSGEEISVKMKVNFGGSSFKRTEESGDYKEVVVCWAISEGHYVMEYDLKEYLYFCEDGEVATQDELDAANASGTKTEEEYKEYLAVYKAKTAEGRLALMKQYGYKTSAFRMVSSEGDVYVCVEAIVMAIVLGLVEAGLLTFATLSTISYIKAKRES